MSNVAFYSTDMRWGGARGGVQVHDGLARGRTTAGGRHYPVPGGMLETAENLRRQYDISRQEQDELAVTSHQRAVAAQKDGMLAEEIIPVTVRSRRGEEVIDTDEHPRADTTVESLSKLKPVLLKDDPDATVTAGNASGQNDAASMCLVTTPERAAELGLTPLVRLVSWAVAAVRAQRDGHRPGAGHRGRARESGLAVERHRPDRTQRGVRRAGSCRDAGVGLRRRRSGPDERARLGNITGSPGRRDRRQDVGHAGPRTPSSRCALRAGNHVHRRRARPCRGFRTGRATVNTPLADLTVVEVSSFVAAPLCGMTLSQLGAEVIRVDPIGGASDINRWPLAASGTSIYWTGLNKGKRSATIDLRSPEGQELVQRLIVEGDGVVVTNASGLSWLSFDNARRRNGPT